MWGHSSGAAEQYATKYPQKQNAVLAFWGSTWDVPELRDSELSCGKQAQKAALV